MRQVRDRRYQVAGEVQGVQVRVGDERGHLRDFVVLQLQDAQLGYERNMAGIDKFELLDSSKHLTPLNLERPCKEFKPIILRLRLEFMLRT